MTWTLVASISIFEVPRRWLDPTQTLSPLAEHALNATEWAHLGTTLAVWLGLPVVIGTWRIARTEIG